MSVSAPGYRLRPLSFDQIPGWSDDDPRALFTAMRSCLAHVQQVRPYRVGSLGLTSEDLMPLLSAAAGESPSDADAARAFFERRCKPFLIEQPGGQRGLVTAFYEPEVSVSDKADDVFRYPFYRRPGDLIEVNDGNRPEGWDPDCRFALSENGLLRSYPDRRAIDGGYLAGRGLEIAWARSKVDVFFAHVQGTARLCHSDGRVQRITYAAKTGQPFSAIGRLLIERNEIAPAEISMQSIRAWLAAHPDQADEVLWHNRSYIFFREAETDDPSSGPIAAAKVPLIAGRALAVDREIHTFGTPFFIRADSLTQLDEGRAFARSMLALDTGSAITGPARGDIFTGSGDIAGELAGNVRHSADFYILIPNGAAARYSP